MKNLFYYIILMLFINLTKLYSQHLYDPAFLGASSDIVSNAPSIPFYPTNIANLSLWWDYRSLPTNTFQVATWTDRVSSVVATYIATVSPTNTTDGIRFSSRTKFTVPTQTIASNYSVWIVFKSINYSASTYKLFIANNATSFGFYIRGDGALDIYNGTPNDGVIVSTNIPYSWVWANGANWTNGVSVTALPTLNGLSLDRIGDDDFTDPYVGYIKFIGIWTNKTLTTTDAANLSTWGLNN